jgi:hypothetical protein
MCEMCVRGGWMESEEKDTQYCLLRDVNDIIDV